MDSISDGSSSSSALMSNEFLHNGAECCVTAEKAVQEMLSLLQPTIVSHQKRLDIVNYVRELIRQIVGDEVMALGSTPLKTYLPDGDIDLTVLTQQTDVEYLARCVCSILEEQSYGDSPIKEVQFVNAQVKIVKCLVQDIWVDISFNQVMGLNALCFLEQMDHYIGRSHLFKRSIILIKAWCFYESRLLGSHHNLLSTYALEVLVFYIINLFHCSLTGPLAVLYKFLECYSTFDWDRYCISVYGPVDINFLPEVVETSAARGSKLLLSKNFLEICINSFSTSKRVLETESQEFPKKHLNIIDPLKGKNNLGRSINKGNFCRTKFAFSYGCQKLRDILKLPVENIAGGVRTFFVNTFGWSRRGRMRGVGVSDVDWQSGTFGLKGDYDCPINCLNYAQWYINSLICGQPSLQILPFLIQSQSVEDEFTQNVYSSGGANFSLSSSVVHPDAFQLLDSALTVDEKEKYLGNDTYAPSASSKGKFKLNAYARPFVSSAVRGTVKCEGTGLFIPEVDMKRKPKSEDTPDMERSPVGLLLKTSMKDQLADIPFESDRVRGTSRFDLPREEFCPPRTRSTEPYNDSESRCFDLSLEDFPLLPRSKKPIQAERPKLVQLTKDSPWAGKLSNRG